MCNNYKKKRMDRDRQYRLVNSQKAIYDAAEDLGIRQKLSGYSQMTPEQKKALLPQVSMIAERVKGSSSDSAVKLIEQFMLPPYMIFDSHDDYQKELAKRVADDASASKNVPHPYARTNGAYARSYANCKYYIHELRNVREELKRVKEENARLEKENAKLIDLLPGRGGSHKRNPIKKSTRRKSKIH